MNYFRNDFRGTLFGTNEATDSLRRRSLQKRILVTGGAGFLGSHLCELLLGAGHEVICLDNFSTGLRRNIAPLKRFDTFRVIAHDVVEPIDLEVDEIYNLACPASPPHYQADPIQTTKTCVIGSLNLLDLAARRGARIFQASTSEIYGDPHVHPQVESYWGNVNPFGPRSCYDEGKRCAETLFFDFHKSHGVEIKIVRIFNTYGPRMRPDDGRVVSNFIVQALKGEDITIYGDGSQTRSFCFVEDLIDGFVRLMASPPSLTGPVNLGNPAEFTIGELAEEVIRLTGSHSKIVRRPLPVDDPRQRRPDISLATEELGWRPKVNLAEGLAHTIRYFDDLLSRSMRESAELV
ncbi:UDP-glucuronic acid decarboxylase family protein [Sinorhizobium meliloti]|uniref:UDP-glucuronic acid decarboxylase family protein n=1 Tax=Rhizobium meliloti TaxID=382 RepID=UPI000B4A4C32|nr:UDP-glucuronic acid decarboxylase family protein [Sinorhizobium meliloti]ASQ14709.1 NAD-dependent epimerase/dehydratase family protein [Sinorhizobium meliloti]MDW9572769.1 NAD-dependent epimerase/dehydratase family protein [Sinorhizobium meliloti]MDX0181779.1 NAD-dependent epimerase/dehydratase family protein [Sinorhizobium meliloti]MDX0278607.1 NAD-dependent epimerase/dehydratase family protein [Sinorhizobium meliloti]MQU81343.1 NAD-dependent epimerase/dehydratase family protein [Sinorhizo